MQILEMRDHLLASELDLEELKAYPGHEPILEALRCLLLELAEQNSMLADDLLLGRRPAPFESRLARPVGLTAAEQALPAAAGEPTGAPSPLALARGLRRRVVNIHDETGRLIALARGELAPDLELVRATWRMFVSPTDWSWRPFRQLWHWDAPPLRHALRAALAIGVAYVISLWLPWGTHDYWILLTIVVVLRGSLAQTIERRNSRVAGTMLGCVIAGALLHADVPQLAVLAIVTLAQAIAHAFAARRYLVTAIAATVLALLQAHMLNADTSATFAVLERMADTLLGAAIAWAFAYVLPSWERRQIPQLVSRTLAAQASHARVALALIHRQQGDQRPELEWRLARRETYDSLSALVQATQRSLSEPRAMRPPLAPLGRLLAHSYQLLAQLTAVKTMLLLRAERLDPLQVSLPLQQAAQHIDLTLSGPVAPEPGRARGEPDGSPSLPAEESPTGDLSPWLLRRLELAGGNFELREAVEQGGELPLLLGGHSNPRPQALNRLDSVGLAQLAHRMPHQLSGGQMQRVAIARALVHSPRLLLADEPTGNLDTATGNSILELLRRICTEQKTTILMATHSAESASFVDTVVRMRDGHIEEIVRS